LYHLEQPVKHNYNRISINHNTLFKIGFHYCVAGALNGKSYITNLLEGTENTEDELNQLLIPQGLPVDDFKRMLGNVIVKPGKVVSLTLLNQKGMFWKNIKGLSGNLHHSRKQNPGNKHNHKYQGSCTSH